jgi:uncharacterized membrane protein YcaP (DUF421 family)
VIAGVLFDGWADFGRVIGVGAAGYVLTVIAVRVAGKRTLAKLNAFDLVVTVALGSVLATIALSREVSLSEGAGAIGLLVVAQWFVSWASVHVSWFGTAVRAEPSIVYDRGRFDDAALTRNRVLRAEVVQAIRASGCGDLELVAVVVLETDGSLSVVTADRCDTRTALPSHESRSPTDPVATADTKGQHV